MDTVERQLITIVAEAVIERRLLDDIKACGARGYSVGHVTGEGTTGRHTHNLNGPSVRIESVVTEDVAQTILGRLANDYFPNFAVIAWLSPVRVARPERF